VARVEYRDGEAIESRDFDLDDDSERNGFIELVRDRDVLTIHTQEPSLEDVFLEANHTIESLP